MRRRRVSASPSVHGSAHVHRRLAADGGRHDGIDEGSARSEAQRPEHRGLIVGIGSDVAAPERRAILELGQASLRMGAKGRVGHGDSLGL